MKATSLNPQLSHELQSLLARLRRSSCSTEKIGFDGQLDCGRVLALAERHGVSALLLENLSDSDELPAEFVSALRYQARAVAASNLLLASELCRLLSAFESAAVDVIPYKGPALAELAYGNLALRRSGDLDLLVDEGNTTRALATLVALGYRVPFALSAAQRRAYERAEAGYECTHPQGFVTDLHFRIVPRHYSIPLEIAPLFERSRSVSVFGRKMQMLSAEDLLIVLAVHGAKHCYERLIWLCDVARVISAEPQLDWDLVLHRAQALRIERIVLLSVALAVEHLNARAPALVRASYERDANVHQLAREIAGLWEHRSEQPAVQRWRMLLEMRERTRDKMISVLRYGSTPTVADLRFVSLPESLFPFYPAVRGIRLISEFVRSRIPHPAADEPSDPVHAN